MKKAVLLKPLDGHPIGATLEFEGPDFDRLVEQGAVKAAPVPQNKMADVPANKAAKAK
jgi:hypothetical protein